MRINDVIKMKVMTFFSNNNTIIQTENFILENEIINEEAIEYIKEKWNKLDFKTSLQKLESIIYKTKTNKWKWILLKAVLYYEIDKKESKKNIEYLEKNYFDNIKKEKEYWDLKYKIDLKDDALEKLVYEFSENREELLLKRYLLEYKYEEALILLKKLNKTNELNYLILKFNQELKILKKEVDILLRVREIIEKLENETLIIKLKILSNLITFLQTKIPLLSNEALNELAKLYLNIYENNFKLSEYIESEWEKDKINIYILIKLKMEFLEINKIKLLEEYKLYLNSYNNIIYLILKNKGYKRCIINFILKEEYSEIEKIYTRLFIMKKYKYLIQNFRKYLKNKIEIPIELKKMEIYSKIMCKRSISIDELKIIEVDKDSKLSELYKIVYNYKVGSLSVEIFRKKILEMLDAKLNIGYFHLCIIRVMYIYDKHWIIENLSKNEEKYAYLIEEVIELATLDYDLNGISYEKICSLESKAKNVNYEAIGIGYVEYKNLNKGLYYLLKAWERSHNLQLADRILYVLLVLEKFNQEVYEYIRKNASYENYILRLRNIIMLSFYNLEEAKVEMNKILLNIPEEIIIQNEIFFKSLQYRFLLKNSSKEFKCENAIYIDKKIKKISEIYRVENDKNELEYFSEDEFEVLNLIFKEKIYNLNRHLIMKILNNKKLKGKKCPGIIQLEFKENENIFEIIKKVTGRDKFEKNKIEYLKGNNKSIISFCGNFTEYYLLMSEYVENFSKNLLNRLEQKISCDSKKILSLDSIIFLCELELFEHLNLKKIYILKSVYNEVKERAEIDDKYKKVILRLHKETSIIDDSDLNDIKREKAIKNLEISIILKIYHGWEITKGDFITEDRNTPFKNKIGAYSSIYLILLYIAQGELDENLLNEKAKAILKIARDDIFSRIRVVN